MSQAHILVAASPLLLLTFSAASVPLATQAQAFAPNSCSCFISHRNLSGSSTAAGSDVLPPSLTLTGNPTTLAQCQYACSAAANPHVQSQAVATAACDVYGANAPNGTLVRAYYLWKESPITSPLSNKYQPAAAIGVLVRSNATTVQEWRCPADWMNNSNQPGGVTTDKGCKKFAGNITLPTPPPNGTKVSNWGFTWNNELWAFNVPPNGGAAILHTIKTPYQCHF
jgi:hypothetical protein